MRRSSGARVRDGGHPYGKAGTQARQENRPASTRLAIESRAGLRRRRAENRRRPLGAPAGRRDPQTKVRETGFEPARGDKPHQVLSLARLPIPPLARQTACVGGGSGSEKLPRAPTRRRTDGKRVA